MEQIFDGIQRPLEAISKLSDDMFIPKGVDIKALDQKKTWEFNPEKFKVGDMVTGGNIIGTVFETDLFSSHKIMVPPRVRGKIQEIAQAGDYTVAEPILWLENERNPEKPIEISMSHYWPVRKPRPVQEKLSGDKPLLTGQRILDALFPTVRGGTCAIPGAFGCGKTCISQALSKHSNSEVIVYVGCGERGNEMAEVLADFPELFIKDDKGVE